MDYSERYKGFISSYFQMILMMKEYGEKNALKDGFITTNLIEKYKKKYKGKDFYYDDAYYAANIILKTISKTYEDTLLNEDKELNDEIKSVLEEYKSKDVFKQIKTVNENVFIIKETVKKLGFNYID